MEKFMRICYNVHRKAMEDIDMDQIKIGKFISECRKNKNMTQAQLAEKLNITDRAVSKWEHGKAMPDSSIMLELCELLDITVNDLLYGEKVSSENYAKKLQDRLMETLAMREKAEFALWRLCIAVEIIMVLAMITVYVYDYFVFTWWSLGVVITWWIINICAFLLFFKYSRQAVGHCRCEKCGTVYLPTAKAWFWTTGSSLQKIRMRCPHCKKRTWHKKVIQKD